MAPPLYGVVMLASFMGLKHTAFPVLQPWFANVLFMNIPLRVVGNMGAVWDHLGIQKFTVANGTLLVSLLGCKLQQ